MSASSALRDAVHRAQEALDLAAAPIERTNPTSPSALRPSLSTSWPTLRAQLSALFSNSESRAVALRPRFEGDWTVVDALRSVSLAGLEEKEAWEILAWQARVGCGIQELRALLETTSASPPAMQRAATVVQTPRQPTLNISPETSGEEKERNLGALYVEGSLVIPFYVSRTVYETFEQYLRHSEIVTRDVPWTEFLSAMAAIGFQGRKRSQGSSWKFYPTGQIANNDTISIHEPSPDSSQRPYQVSWTGKRLVRAYGLDITMFAIV